MLHRWLIPEGVDKQALPLLIGPALRAFADGFIAILLPAYLIAMGLRAFDVGILSTGQPASLGK